VTLTDWKKGGMIKYTFWPGLGKRPMVENKVNDAMAPESSFPGRPAREELKREGMSRWDQNLKLKECTDP